MDKAARVDLPGAWQCALAAIATPSDEGYHMCQHQFPAGCISSMPSQKLTSHEDMSDTLQKACCFLYNITCLDAFAGQLHAWKDCTWAGLDRWS